MTYWSRIWRISRGVGRSDLAPFPPLSEAVSSRMMSLHSSMHSSQIKTDGPAMSFRTSCWLLPQNEQYSSFSPEEDFSDMGLGVLPRYEDFVHQAVLYRFFGSHEKVPVGVPGDGLNGLAGVLGEDLVQPGLQIEDFLGVDLDIGDLALEAARGLVNHDARVGQAKALAVVARRQQRRAHARRLADA